MVNISLFYKVLYIPGGAGGAGFLPSTVPPQPSGHSFDCSARPWRNFFLKVVSRDQGVCQCVRGRLLLGGYIYIYIYTYYIYTCYRASRYLCWPSANLPTIAVFGSGACCVIFVGFWVPSIYRTCYKGLFDGGSCSQGFKVLLMPWAQLKYLDGFGLVSMWSRVSSFVWLKPLPIWRLGSV